jgi:hypothetical protein
LDWFRFIISLHEWCCPVGADIALDLSQLRMICPDAAFKGLQDGNGAPAAQVARFGALWRRFGARALRDCAEAGVSIPAEPAGHAGLCPYSLQPLRFALMTRTLSTARCPSPIAVSWQEEEVARHKPYLSWR